MRRFLAVALLACGLVAALPAQESASFTAGTATAERGHRANGFLDVPPGADAGTRIPVIVFHGAWPGPVLAIVSGSHGTEYASIVAVEKLADRVDPAELHGTLILVPLVNVASFEHKVVHVNPVDGKSMNRLYPGRMDGTQSERAAFVVTRDVVEKCDHLIDLHGGDLDESLIPYTYWLKTGNEKLDAAAREMVLAFGLDHVIIASDRPRDPAASRYLDNTAAARGKPAMVAEAGHAGRVDAEDVDALVRGCLSVMRLLQMVPGTPTKVEHPVWLDSVKTVSSDHTGIFRSFVRRGQYVEAGAKLGEVRDWFGTVLSEPRAPAAGIVLYVCAVPSMRRGDTVANVGVIGKGP